MMARLGADAAARAGVSDGAHLRRRLSVSTTQIVVIKHFLGLITFSVSRHRALRVPDEFFNPLLVLLHGAS